MKISEFMACVLGAALILVTVSNVSADMVSVTVWGEAIIYNADRPQAKERAMQEAFSAAITQVMGAYITAESFTQNYVSIDHSVLSKTKGYIKNYEILESREEADTLHIKLMVAVSAESVKDDLTALGILLDAAGNPVTEFLGSDEGLESSESVPVFRQIFSDRGFRIAEEESVSDVRIEIKGKIRNSSMAGGLYGAVAELNARAVRSSTKDLIASESAVSNGAGMSRTAALKQAFQQAAESLAPKLMEKITAKWSEELANGRMLSLTVTADEYSKVQEFSACLGRVFGVKKADMKSFSDKEARYLVRFAGQSKTLADLMGKIQSSDFRVIVKGFDADSLDLRLE